MNAWIKSIYPGFDNLDKDEKDKVISDWSRAADAINDFTRIKMREDAFVRRIMPPMLISNDELDRSVPSDYYVSDTHKAESKRNGT